GGHEAVVWLPEGLSGATSCLSHGLGVGCAFGVAQRFLPVFVVCMGNGEQLPGLVELGLCERLGAHLVREPDRCAPLLVAQGIDRFVVECLGELIGGAPCLTWMRVLGLTKPCEV